MSMYLKLQMLLCYVMSGSVCLVTTVFLSRIEKQFHCALYNDNKSPWILEWQHTFDDEGLQPWLINNAGVPKQKRYRSVDTHALELERAEGGWVFPLKSEKKVMEKWWRQT